MRSASSSSKKKQGTEREEKKMIHFGLVLVRSLPRIFLVLPFAVQRLSLFQFLLLHI